MGWWPGVGAPQLLHTALIHQDGECELGYRLQPLYVGRDKWG